MIKTTETLSKNYNLERIEFLMNNKSKITEEILTDLRSYGLSGKQIALDLLEIKDDETIQDIHCIEIEKCKNDVFYFKENYLLLLNKDKMQDKALEGINIYNTVHLNSKRKTKKSYSACIYTLWLLNFHRNKTIGIATYKTVWAKDNISIIANLYNHIPNWMRTKSRNLKTSMTSELNTKIIIDLVDEKAFRGISLDILIVDCLDATNISKFNNFKECVVPMLSVKNYKSIFIGDNPNILIQNAKEINEFTELPVKVANSIFRESIWNKMKRFFKELIG